MIFYILISYLFHIAVARPTYEIAETSTTDPNLCHVFLRQDFYSDYRPNSRPDSRRYISDELLNSTQSWQSWIKAYLFLPGDGEPKYDSVYPPFGLKAKAPNRNWEELNKCSAPNVGTFTQCVNYFEDDEICKWQQSYPHHQFAEDTVDWRMPPKGPLVGDFTIFSYMEPGVSRVESNNLGMLFNYNAIDWKITFEQESYPSCIVLRDWLRVDDSKERRKILCSFPCDGTRIEKP